MKKSMCLVLAIAVAVALVGCDDNYSTDQPQSISPERAAEMNRRALEGRPEALRIHEQAGANIVAIPNRSLPESDRQLVERIRQENPRLQRAGETLTQGACAQGYEQYCPESYQDFQSQ